MMGVGHAALGSATWVTGAMIVMPQFGMEPTAAQLALGCLPVAGAALIPDIDHPNGTIANSGGFITRGIANITNEVSGGHREGTHRLWFWAAVTVACFATVAINQWVGLGWFFVLTAFGAQALSKTWLHQKMNKRWRSKTGVFAKAYAWAFALVATLIAWWVYPEESMWWWLPFAISVGHLSHLGGDALTTAGLEWTQGKKLRAPVLGDAGSGREVIFTAVLTVWTLVFIYCGFVNTNPVGFISDIFGVITDFLHLT